MPQTFSVQKSLARETLEHGESKTCCPDGDSVTADTSGCGNSLSPSWCASTSKRLLLLFRDTRSSAPPMSFPPKKICMQCHMIKAELGWSVLKCKHEKGICSSIDETSGQCK